MNTVRAKKIRWGRLMSRDSKLCENPRLLQDFPHFDGENAHLTDSCAGANQARSGKS